MKTDLTADRLRELLDYNPDTGVFTWRKTSGRAGAGSVAGRSHHQGYCQIGVDGYRHSAHRLAWLHFYGEWPKAEIDHINGLRSDNRIANLRDVPLRVNQQNRRQAHATKRSCDLLGVTWNKRQKRWIARLIVDGDVRFVDRFTDPQEAHAAYIEAKRKFHPGSTL